MGKRYGLNGKQLLNLAACAVLHDNALTEYEASELNKGLDILQNKSELDLKDHCIMGEKNLSLLPFYKDAKGTILYHHVIEGCTSYPGSDVAADNQVRHCKKFADADEQDEESIVQQKTHEGY